MAKSNADSFNPYHRWLGIPEKKCPPTFYELLGISLNEEEPAVISSAAERQKTHVEQFLGTEFNKFAIKLISQIDEGEITLLSPELRRQYDQQVDLFKRRRKNRQFDPNAIPSPIEMRGGRTVGEESGLVREYAGIVSILLVAFMIMAAFTFMMPWQKVVFDNENGGNNSEKKVIDNSEKNPIDSIKALWGKIDLDDTGNVIKVSFLGTKVSDAELVHLKGLTSLTTLILEDTKISDAGLVYLKGLTSLKSLNLRRTNITDAGLEHLKGLTSLTTLILDNTEISDAGLVYLKGLTSLTVLNLDNTEISDAGLVHLIGLTSLTTLILQRTNITDTGLEHLKGLTSLKSLGLGSNISDAGLVHLKGLNNLTYLFLGNTNISDAGLVHLKDLNNLTTLILSGTNISDVGFEHLNGLTKLTFLNLHGTKVTKEGVMKLKAVIPDCKINH